MSETLLKKEKVGKLELLYKGFKDNMRNKYAFIIAMSLIIVSILGYYFISTDENYYNKTIAKIISIAVKEESQAGDMNGNIEQINKQQIKAVIMNGAHKGENIELQNTTSYSQANDLNFKVNDEVFVSIKEDNNKKIVSSQILDFKRDKYLTYIIIMFVLLILLIGGFKGFKSLASVIANIIIFSAVIELYLRGYNLAFTASIASMLFIILSISMVSGVNKKTVSAVVGTMVATLISMLIAIIVIKITHNNGVHYEEMEFLTRPPEQIFIVEVLIGTLGGIMDIAISISSAIKEIYDKNPSIEKKALVKSGMEIGKDIMGTMANTLVFAYISGSIPMILLWLKNGNSISYIINFNISLEIIRALTGSIGIVLSIPITLYISAMLLKKHKIGEVKA